MLPGDRKSAMSVSELNSLPMSPELLEYYHDRLAASEDEMRALHKRIDDCAASQATQHKARWEAQKRSDEVADLQKALSDSHIYLWEERAVVTRLQAEIDELKIQEVEDRRKIQHLLSLTDPCVQVWSRSTPPAVLSNASNLWKFDPQRFKQKT